MLFYLCIPVDVYTASEKTGIILAAVGSASESYHNEFASWPASLADLTNNPKKIEFVSFNASGAIEGWGHPLIYQPFDPAKGHGAVISYGRDGKPGGTGADADLEVRFGP